MAKREAGSHRLLLLKDGNILLPQSYYEHWVPAIPVITQLLADSTVTQAYIAGTKLFSTLGELNNLVQNVIPGWRMRITNRRRHAFISDRRYVTGRFFIDYFSIDERRNGKRTPRRRFDIINLDLLTETPPTNAHDQMEMALALLEMCDHRGIRFRGTRGGLGCAMLKASDRWDGRCAAPNFINQRARLSLPGNFYSISNKVQNRRGIGPIPHCYYVDQTSAHHSIALSSPIPHPRQIRGRGFYKTQAGKWLETIPNNQIGLVLCRLIIQSIPPTLRHLYPPWALKHGTRNVYLWTPELRLLQNDHRINLEYYIASFTATTRDMVLPEYAEWALREISLNPERAKYKKGSLLAAYGMLAFNSGNHRTYRYWGGDTTRQRVNIPVAGDVGESVIQLPNHVQPSTVNVIARGIIESETRTRSIEYARELHHAGYHIPQIYADGLLVETDQLPFIKDGWRVSHSLTNVFIPRSNAIVSDQVVKLPGVGRSTDDRECEGRRSEAGVLPSLMSTRARGIPRVDKDELSIA